MTDPNAALDAIAASLAVALPGRTVQRSMPADPLQLADALLEAGVVCLVTEGGGGFVKYLGREGELGTLRAALVAFVKVGEGTERADVERAELTLLSELLAWVRYPNGPTGMTVSPAEFRNSKQLEHPYGWLVLGVEVEF